MNPNITYLTNSNSNSISCLSTTLLSAYILTDAEHQYIDNLPENTNTIITNLLLTASIKAGSSLYTQPELNKIYARVDSASYSGDDKNIFKNYMNKKMVGNNSVSFSEMSE